MTTWVEVVEWNGPFAFKGKFPTWDEALKWVESQGEVTAVSKAREVIEHDSGLAKAISRHYVVDGKDNYLIIKRTKYGTKPNSL